VDVQKPAEGERREEKRREENKTERWGECECEGDGEDEVREGGKVRRGRREEEM
jgi:hypothetical protein